MKIARTHPARVRRRGFTVLEVTIAVAVFAVLGLVISETIGLAGSSHRTVVGVIENNRQMRDATGMLKEELRLTSEANMTVTVLPDGNSELTLMQPLAVGGAIVWGALNPQQGTTPEQQAAAGWRIRYTVIASADGNGSQLVRQLLDDTGAVRRNETIAAALHPNVNPAFSVVAAGEMWEVTLVTAAYTSGGQGREMFHVKPRN